MCGICIGGMCIPYEAILPILLIALQWVATQFAKVGLQLPAFIKEEQHKMLRRRDNDNDDDNDIDLSKIFSCVAGCLCGKRNSRNKSNAEDASINSDESTASISTTDIDEDETWEECLDIDDGDTVVISNKKVSDGDGTSSQVTRGRNIDVKRISTVNNDVQFPNNLQWCMPCQ